MLHPASTLELLILIYILHTIYLTTIWPIGCCIILCSQHGVVKGLMGKTGRDITHVHLELLYKAEGAHCKVRALVVGALRCKRKRQLYLKPLPELPGRSALVNVEARVVMKKI